MSECSALSQTFCTILRHLRGTNGTTCLPVWVTPYQGCQHQSEWYHPGWSHWGWTCSSACRRSPWSAPAAGDMENRLVTQWHDILCLLFNWRESSSRLSNVLYLGHVVVVLGEVGELLIHGELHLVGVAAVLCHGCDSYSVCNEKKKREGVSSLNSAA